jgi:ribosomal protein S18 acetylase RimI-like enzyme
MVRRECRNAGIGKKLLDKTERKLKQEGISKVFLLAFKKNRTGNRFWHNNGYGTRTDLNYRDKTLD